MTEAQKYQGKLYRPEKEKKGKNANNNNNRNNNNSNSTALVPDALKAYVEDAADDEYNRDVAYGAPPPAAPSPPRHEPQSEQAPVNVFDFLVDSQTPNQSRTDLTVAEPMLIENTPGAVTQVHFENIAGNKGSLVEYGSGPVPSAYQTPLPREQRERKEKKKDRKSSDEKKSDKKRKRLHVDTSQDLVPISNNEGDEIMTDAPPVLHSGLTGGLNRLNTRSSVFPPSPDYSGGDANEVPNSPLKRSKHKHSKKERKSEGLGQSIMGLLTQRQSSDSSKALVKARKSKSKSSSSKKTKPRKLLDSKAHDGDDNRMVVYKQPAPPDAELFMALVNKGPESGKGCSLNKVLKRYHRERLAAGVRDIGAKAEEEKELWRVLRLKKNENGEVVVFCAGSGETAMTTETAMTS